MPNTPAPSQNFPAPWTGAAQWSEAESGAKRCVQRTGCRNSHTHTTKENLRPQKLPCLSFSAPAPIKNPEESEKLTGEIEADETYIGGKVRNMHVDKQRKRGRGTGGVGKAIVMGLLQRHGKVKVRHIPNARRDTVQQEVRANVEPGSKVYTDALPSYNGLNRDFIHEAINHAECYVRGSVHTNGLENYWSLLKRGIRGTYVSVEPFHLFRYLDEQAFRFNFREENDAWRFLKAVGSIFGKRLTYSQLIGEPRPA